MNEDGIRKFWRSIKGPLGLFLFVIAVVYGIYKTPPELLYIQPVWLAAAIINIFFIFLIQILQVYIFIYVNSLRPDWLFLSLFTVRKGMLNSIMPVKSGTLILINMISKHYRLSWSEFFIFMVIGAVASLFISLFVFVWILWDLKISLFLSFGLSALLYNFRSVSYIKTLPVQVIIALLQFMAILIGFFCILRGLGFKIEMLEAAYFAVTLNILAQISITPGNLGIREIVTGTIAPYVALPVSVGILSGAIFFSLRIGVYSLLLGLFEWLYYYRKHNDSKSAQL